MAVRTEDVNMEVVGSNVEINEKEAEWAVQENERRKVMKKMDKNLSDKMLVSNSEDSIDNMQIDEEKMSKLEKEIYRFVQNSVSIYDRSDEEPSAVYYNDDNTLRIVSYEDKEGMTRMRELDKNRNRRYDEYELGPGKIVIRLKDRILTNNRNKNLSKIIFTLHKIECAPAGIEMVNRSTASVLFDSKCEANKCMDILDSMKLLSAYIDFREKSHKVVISDWPNGIPELFQAIDARKGVLRMERMKRRVLNKESNRYDIKPTDNIIITVKGKERRDSFSIYERSGYLRARPYVASVRQCYNCFKYGHMKFSCRVKAKCVVYGDEAHGECKRDAVCCNCGKQHRSMFRGCEDFLINKSMQVVMANNNCSWFEACKIIEGKEAEVPRNYNRYMAPKEWPSFSSPYTDKTKSNNKNSTSQKVVSSTQSKRLKSNEEYVHGKYKRSAGVMKKNLNERVISANVKYDSQFNNREEELTKDKNGIVFKFMSKRARENEESCFTKEVADEEMNAGPSRVKQANPEKDVSIKENQLRKINVKIAESKRVRRDLGENSYLF